MVTGKDGITMRNKKKNEEKKSKVKQIQLDREYFLKKWLNKCVGKLCM